MNALSYQEWVSSMANKPDFSQMDDTTSRLLQGLMTASTETNEAIDLIWKAIRPYRQKPLDRDRVIEELGDALFGIAVACTALETSIPDVMSANIQKLNNREREADLGNGGFPISKF